MMKKPAIAIIDENRSSRIERFALGLNKADWKVIEEIENILLTFNLDFETLLKKIRETPVFQQRLDKCRFEFEDIKLLDDNSIKLLLGKTDTTVLTKALKRASVDLLDRIFCNLSERAAAMLKEDMEFAGPLTLEEVEDAQAEVVKEVMNLHRDGKITIR